MVSASPRCAAISPMHGSMSWRHAFAVAFDAKPEAAGIPHQPPAGLYATFGGPVSAEGCGNATPQQPVCSGEAPARSKKTVHGRVWVLDLFRRDASRGQSVGVNRDGRSGWRRRLGAMLVPRKR